MLMTLLRARGVDCDSAGTAAAPGDPASEGAVRAMARRGLSLAGHASTPLQSRDLGAYDRIWAMTPRHAAAVRALGVPAARLAVIQADAGGVPDPCGGDDSTYEACALVLERAAEEIAHHA